MKIAAFDDNRDYFAVIGADNRLALWNTSNSQLKKEFVEESQLADNYTCIAWAPSSKENNSSRGLRQSILAVGTASGGIIVWDLSQGKVIHFLEGHRASVNHLVFSKNGEFLYSCSDDQFVIQWSLSTDTLIHKFKKDTQPLTRLALSPDETVLAVAGTVIKLIDLASKKVTKKFGGHSKGVTALHFSEDGELLFSAANDRYVLVWDASTASTNTTQVHSLISETNTLELDVSYQGESLYHVLGFSLNGPEVSVWECRGGVDPSSKRKPVAASSTLKSQVVRAAFTNSDNLIVAKEAGAKVTFSVLRYQQDSEIVKEISEVVAASVIKTAEKEKKAKLLLPSDGKVARSGFGSAPAESSLTIQQQLDNIQASLQNDKDNSVSDTVVADSLQNIVQQALQKNDENLLTQLLSVTKPNVISNTVAKLPPHFVSELMAVLVQRLEAGLNTYLLVWLRSIFQHHASYLIAGDDKISGQLEGLYVMMSSRVSTFKKLCKLNGKLDILLSQSHRFTQQIENGPVYEESSEDEDDEGAEGYGISEDEESDEEGAAARRDEFEKYMQED